MGGRCSARLKSCPDTRPVGLGSCYPTSQNRDMGHPFFCGGLGRGFERGFAAYFVSRKWVGGLRQSGMNPRPTGRAVTQNSAGVGLCYPTLSAKTKARQGWGTPFLWWMKAVKSNRRSFDSLRCASVAQDDSCGYPGTDGMFPGPLIGNGKSACVHESNPRGRKTGYSSADVEQL